MNIPTEHFFLLHSLRRSIGIIFSILLAGSITFQANAQVKITNVSAISGINGDVITVTGSGFTTISTIYAGSIALKTGYSALTGNLTAAIPKGVSYERISVTNTGAVTAQSDIFFTMKSTKYCAFNAFNFDTVKVMETGIVATANIALEDVDKDGLKDLLQLSTGKLTTYKNTSSSAGVSFNQNATNALIAGAVPSAIVIYDLNNDGNPDAVIGYRTGNKISILTGLSTGGFSADPTNITVGNVPRTIAAGDLDNDGIAEIIVGNASDKSLSVLKYYVVNRAGAYKVDQTITGITAASIAIADMDNEGNKDIIFADGSAGFYLPNLKNLTFDKAQKIASEVTSLLSVGDYDGNKQADILFAVPTGIYSTFNSSIAVDTKLGTSPIAMTPLDINFDGIPDLAILYKDPNTGTNSIAFFENDGKNLVSPTLPLIYETGVSGNVNLVSADLDGDSQGDLVTFDAKGNIYIYHKSNAVNLYNITATTPCLGQDAPVSAETNNGAFVWYADAKKSVTIDKQPSTKIPALYLKSLTNTVYVQVQSGTCFSDLRPVTINVNPLPDATASAKFPYLCQNDFSILLSVDASGKRTGSAYKYQWSSTTDIASPTLDSTNVTPADKTFITGTGSAGQFPAEKTTIYTYNLTVTNPATGCIKTSSVAVNVYNYAATLTSSADVICSGAKVSFTASITNGTFLGNTFKWTNNGNATNPKDGVFTASLAPVNTTTAIRTLTYTISGQTAMGCPVSASKSISINPPQVISPSSLPRTIANGTAYSQVFSTNDGNTATFTMQQITDPLPTEFSFKGNIFSGTPKSPYKGTFLITSTETGKCPGSAQYTFIVDDLADPNLIVFPMYKNVGDQPFFIQPVTQSAGEIKYSLKNAQDPNAGCVTIGSKGYVTISCAASTDSIPVIVKQDATAKYKGVTIETFIKVSPNKDTKVLLATSGVIAGGDTTSLKYFTNSDADKSAIEFVQLNNTNLAEIKPDGTIIPGTQTGTVDVEIRIPATLNYAAVSRTFTITVYAAVQKPIISTDTVVITVAQDTIINILENDLGVTRAIDPAQTDIDMENNGVQNKYYSLTMGNFLIDLNGNLQIRPFSGFVGEGKLGYTVTDSAGVKSEIGYVLIKVVPLTVTPPLKANEVMTPNSDGYNDGLVIAYANLTSNSLTIMDEAGNIVFETTNYQNDWTGINKKGKPVEAGVYYYVYKENDGRELIQYIQVVR